jgi:putative ABC transport system permease protein
VKALRFALGALPRDIRVHEMRVVAAALVVSVAAISAVGFFIDRVEGGMEQRATSLLGADVVLESDDPVAQRFLERAESEGLRIAQTVSFPSVVVVGEQSQLVQIKAVTAGYPLRGQAFISDQPFAEGAPAQSVPQPGTVWLDPRLFPRLGVEVGDSLPLGEIEPSIAAVLVSEPDRAGSLFTLAPRVMMNRADLEATGLVSAGSRVEHRVLLAGPAEAMDRYRLWISSQPTPSLEIEDVRRGRPAMGRALDRASVFLGLAAIMAVILAGGAIAVAVHSFSARESDVSALLRCFGASQRLVTGSLLLRLLFVGLFGSALGVLVGWLAQAGLVGLIGEWFEQELPAPTFVPVVVGLVTGLATLTGFGLVPALRIRRVPVMRVLHRAHAPPEPSAFAAVIVALVTIALLIVYQADDIELSGYVLAGTFGLLLVLGLASAGLVLLVRRFQGDRVCGWRFGLASVARRPQTSTVQLVGFGLGLLALLLLAVVRLDVLNAWQRNLPENTPDQFMVNVQPADVGAIKERMRNNGIDVERFYPMTRARLLTINGMTPDEVQGDDPEQDFDQDQGRRGVNMSWAAQPRDDNPVVAGKWWTGGEAVSEFSVEEGFAERTGIDLGDELEFRIGGETVTGRVTSFRKVDWDSFRVNFFVIASPSVLEGMPSTWITSFWLPPGRHDVITNILRDYPGVTVLDVGRILEQVRTVIDQGTRAVEYVFGFSLLAGLIVLIAAVQASRDQRRTEIAILRTHGASRRRVRAMLLAEFATLGGLAGTIAAAGALATGWAITTRVLDIPWQLNPEILLIGIGGGAIGIALAGLLATRHLLAERPMAVLRSE